MNGVFPFDINGGMLKLEERKPSWLKVKLPNTPGYFETKQTVDRLKLNTVCEDSICPNIAECWGRKTCTIMILGDVCTRSCGFCAVKSGRPLEFDPDEPRRVAEAIQRLGIRYAVITSVARDDLEDDGSHIFAETVRQVRELSPETKIETLIPDFRAKVWALQKVWDSRPDVLSHNVESVPRLDKVVRGNAFYERSRFVLSESKLRCPGMKVKTGIQVGHGENWDELLDVMDDLARIGVDVLTLGQYLRPTKIHRPVHRYYTPEEFDGLRKEAKKRGIPYVFSGPLVRSSYRAEEVFLKGDH